MKSFSIDAFDIIDTLYAAAMDSEHFEALLKTWSNALGKSDAFAVEFEKTYAGHLDRANQLLDLEDHPQSDDAQDSRIARFVLDRHNKVISLNAEASVVFGARETSPLIDLSLQEASRGRLETAIQIARAGQAQLVVLCTIGGQNLLAEISPNSETPGADQLIVESRQFVSSDEINRLLTGAFSLTPSEVDILGLVLSGKTPQEIAAIRERKLPTVRSQIKSLLEKTATQSQVELIRMVMGLAAAVSLSEDDQTLPMVRTQSTAHPSARRYTLGVSNNRRVEYSFRGARYGTPILFCHDEFFGDGMTPQFDSRLNELGIKLICVFRPGYGATDRVDKKQSYADIVLTDTHAVLDALKIRKPVPVVSRGVGFFRAVMMAYQNTGLIRSILGVRPALPWDADTDISSAPPYTRLVVRMSKNAPKSFEFIAKAGYRYFLRYGAKNFIQKYYLSADSDMSLIERRSDILKSMEAGAEHALKHGVSGTGKDLVASKIDWQPAATALRVPVKLIVGEDDPTTRRHRAKTLALSNANVSLEIIPATGHLVFFSHPYLLADTIAKMLKQETSLSVN